MMHSRLLGGTAALLLLLCQSAAAQSSSDLIAAAREAAWTDRNAEAVELYEQAFAASPELRAANIREYADQLTYSGRSADAVPIYREILRSRAARRERTLAQRGLALALTWSGQPMGAVAAWDLVLETNPSDADARQNRDRLLLEAARAAAEADRNAEAATLYGRALRSQQTRPVGLVKAYADQLTYAGRQNEAVRLYRDLLATPGISDDIRAGAERGLALALQWSGQPAPAETAWRGVLSRNPRDTDARKNLGEVLVTQARTAADEQAHAQSVTFYDGAFDVVPARRDDLLLDYAYQVAYAGRPSEAAALFEEIVLRNELNITDRLGHRGLGMSLAWAERYNEALAAYDRALAKYPDDVELLNGKAQTLIWMDRVREARVVYHRALIVEPRNETSVRGAAQSDSYLGRQRQATGRLDEIIAQGDVSDETMLVAARAEFWKGRPDKAFALADRLLSDAPNHSEALALINDINDSKRPTTELFQGWSTQSNGLEIATTTGRVGLSFGSGLTSGGVQVRDLNFNPDVGGDVNLTAPGFFLRHRFDDDWEGNASVHFNTLTGPGFRHEEVTFDAWLTYWVSDVVRTDFSLSRNYFDDVRSLAANIRMDTLGVSADYMPIPGAQFSARAKFSDLTDGNSRVFFQLEGRAGVRGRPGLFAGGRLTYYGFSDPELDNGYFNPSWLYSAEGILRYTADISERWRLESSLGVGFERRSDLDKLLWNVGAKASYRLTDDAALEFEFQHNDHKRVDPVDGFVRTTVGTRLVFKW